MTTDRRPKQSRPIFEDDDDLALQLMMYATGDRDGFPLSELLAHVELRGGWKGDALRRAGQVMICKHVDEPEVLRALRGCDSSIFEGEEVAILWTAALAKVGLSAGGIENLFRNYERPAKLGGAPFDWFVANHSDWPHELLARCGVNPDCAGPPTPLFIEKMLAYEIPEAEREQFAEACASNESQWPRTRLPKTMFALVGKLPVKSILAGLAQEVMSERVNLDIDFRFVNTKLQIAKFSPAAKQRFRERVIIDVIVNFWSRMFKHTKNRVVGRAWTAEIEEFPEIHQDERFLWAVEGTILHFGEDCISRPPAAMLRAAEQLRGARIQEKPIMDRDYFTGAAFQPAEEMEN